MHIAMSLMYFLAAGLCEIGGGYLVWLWLREGKNVWLAVLGAVVLVLYRDYSYPPARKFWPGLCCLWWRLCGALLTLGVEDRWRYPGHV